MSHIFISYSHEDSDYVHQLREQMLSMDFQVWIDEEIEYSERWFQSIVKAIESCSVVIVVMTPEAEESSWVEKEIMLAHR